MNRKSFNDIIKQIEASTYDQSVGPLKTMRALDEIFRNPLAVNKNEAITTSELVVRIIESVDLKGEQEDFSGAKRVEEKGQISKKW